MCCYGTRPHKTTAHVRRKFWASCLYLVVEIGGALVKILVGNTYSKLVDATPQEIALVDSELAVKVPNYYFNPSFRAGYWDGKEHFFSKRDSTFPTGLLWKVTDLFEDVEVIDERTGIKQVDIPEKIQLFEPTAEGGVITLRDYQYEAVETALKRKRGIVNVATNGGKTEIAGGIIKCLLPTLQKGETILFLTHSKEIFHQSAERLAKRLGIEVGKVGDGIWDVKPLTFVMIPTVSKYLKRVTKLNEKQYTKGMRSIRFLIKFLGQHIKKGEENRAIMIQALEVLEEEDEKHRDQTAIDILTEIISENKTDEKCWKAFQELKEKLAEFEEAKLAKLNEAYERTMNLLKSAVCIIGDEAHHSSSSTWYDTLMLCENAAYRFGLTGTVDKKDVINTMRLYGCMGSILVKISNEFLISRGYSAKPTIYLQVVNNIEISGVEWQDAYRIGIVENEYRNRLITEKVVEKYEEGKGCLIIVNHIKHGEILQKMLEDMGVECEFTHGKRDSEDRERFLKEMKAGKLKVLIATSILDEGVDISGINCLWLASGGRSYRQVLQRIGRGLRKKEDGSGVEIYDFLDYTSKYLIQHTQERYSYYKQEGFEIKKI